MGRRLYAKLQAHGAETRVYVSTKATDDEGKPCHGTTTLAGEKPEIEIAWSEDRNAMEMTYLHELMHEAVKNLSGDARKKAIRGKTLE